MSDFDYLISKNAELQIKERVARSRSTRIPGQRRHPRRHKIAHSLHALANRLDAD